MQFQTTEARDVRDTDTTDRLENISVSSSIQDSPSGFPSFFRATDETNSLPLTQETPGQNTPPCYTTVWESVTGILTLPSRFTSQMMKTLSQVEAAASGLSHAADATSERLDFLFSKVENVLNRAEKTLVTSSDVLKETSESLRNAANGVTDASDGFLVAFTGNTRTFCNLSRSWGKFKRKIATTEDYELAHNLLSDLQDVIRHAESLRGKLYSQIPFKELQRIFCAPMQSEENDTPNSSSASVSSTETSGYNSEEKPSFPFDKKVACLKRIDEEINFVIKVVKKQEREIQQLSIGTDPMRLSASTPQGYIRIDRICTSENSNLFSRVDASLLKIKYKLYEPHNVQSIFKNLEHSMQSFGGACLSTANSADSLSTISDNLKLVGLACVLQILPLISLISRLSVKPYTPEMKIVCIVLEALSLAITFAFLGKFFSEAKLHALGKQNPGIIITTNSGQEMEVRENTYSARAVILATATSVPLSFVSLALYAAENYPDKNYSIPLILLFTLSAALGIVLPVIYKMYPRTEAREKHSQLPSGCLSPDNLESPVPINTTGPSPA